MEILNVLMGGVPFVGILGKLFASGDYLRIIITITVAAALSFIWLFKQEAAGIIRRYFWISIGCFVAAASYYAILIYPYHVIEFQIPAVIIWVLGLLISCSIAVKRYRVSRSVLDSDFILLLGVAFLGLLILFTVSFLPVNGSDCDTFNWIIEGSRGNALPSFCSSKKFQVAFIGGYSTGKTSIISSILGHAYKDAVIDVPPTTDKFVAIAPDGISSEEKTQWSTCSVLATALAAAPNFNVERLGCLSDSNADWTEFVFIDTPGYLVEYLNETEHPHYKQFYRGLANSVDFIFLTWTAENGILHEGLCDILKSSVAGRNFDVIWNRWPEQVGKQDQFLASQFAKCTGVTEQLRDAHMVPMNTSPGYIDAISRISTRLKELPRLAERKRSSTQLSQLNEINLKGNTMSGGLASLWKCRTAQRLARTLTNKLMK